MRAFTQHDGLVAPMDRANVDTDLMVPKQFLKSIKRSGFGPNLFDALRYLDERSVRVDGTVDIIWRWYVITPFPAGAGKAWPVLFNLFVCDA